MGSSRWIRAAFVLVASPIAHLAAQVPAGRPGRDSAYVLPPLTVTRSPEPANRAPVSVDVIDSATIRRGQLTVGLDEALANVPGVYVSNRYNFSLDQRLSIRGFGSRSNFGLRGVKVLLDGIPQTLPDGQSQLNNVDFGAVDRIEVLRGASSSLYGNASGGIISMRSEGAGPEPFAQRVRSEYGAFGTDKWQSFTSARRGAFSGTLSASRFTTSNFRQQGYADLRRLSGGLQWAASPSTVLDLRLLASDDPHAMNPGALTPAEYARNRDTAAVNNILRGADKNVQQQQGAVTLRHTDATGGQYEFAVFGLLRTLENPLATPPPNGPQGPTIGTWVTIDRQVGGARATASRRLSANPMVPRVTVGADFQRMRDDRSNVRSQAGQKTATVLLDQREKVTEIGPFAQLVWTPTEKLLIGAGGRYDRVTFDVTDRYLGDGVDNSGRRPLTAWDGSAGASYEVRETFVPYANVSTSFETPTTTELANQPGTTGGFNNLLRPQRSTNYEVGARGRLTRYANYTATVFRSDVRDAIVQYREIGGRAFFQNAGRTRNNGVELGLSLNPIPGVRLFGSYTFSNYRFRDYKIVTGTRVDTLDGNRVAGVPRNFARIGLRAEPGHAFAVDIDHTISSSLFADDANTAGVGGWGVTNARVSWMGTLGSGRFSPFVGFNNIFNRKYIGAVTVNGAFNRVLEPAPTRNMYVGAELGYRAR
jgi:iron complex outermembrane receptor protein